MADEEVTPSLAEVLREHEQVRDPFKQCRVCLCDKWADRDYEDGGHGTHADHLAAVLVERFVVLPNGELERERGQWQGVIDGWADAYAEQSLELDALKLKQEKADG